MNVLSGTNTILNSLVCVIVDDSKQWRIDSTLLGKMIQIPIYSLRDDETNTATIVADTRSPCNLK